MLLYVSCQKYCLRPLQEQCLKISRLTDLNDLFEILGWNLRDNILAVLSDGSWK